MFTMYISLFVIVWLSLGHLWLSTSVESKASYSILTLALASQNVGIFTVANYSFQRFLQVVI
jgi:hypothetical protein